MKSKLFYIYYLIYFILGLFFLFLFLSESPFKINKRLLQYSEIFSVGWNFFTKDPRLDLTEVYYYKNDKWIELGKSGNITDVIGRENDAVQSEIFSYISSVPEDKWINYNSMYDCYSDLITKNPQNNYFSLENLPNTYHSKEFIKQNYGEYILLISAQKMPWAWLKTYSQIKMKCKSLIVKI